MILGIAVLFRFLKLQSVLDSASQVDLRGLRVGLCIPTRDSIDSMSASVVDAPVLQSLRSFQDFLEGLGVELVDLSASLSKWEEQLLSIYYILATAEASSNLGRYDGIRYGFRLEGAQDLKELYIRSRTQGFGPEIRRRILMGTFVLSTGYYDAYYNKAQQLRAQLSHEYQTLFKQVDVLLSPTSPSLPFAIGEKQSPLAMYHSDIFTIPAALSGLPSCSLPIALHTEGGSKVPMAVQLTAARLKDEYLLGIAHALEQEWSRRVSQGNLEAIDYSCFTID